MVTSRSVSESTRERETYKYAASLLVGSSQRTPPGQAPAVASSDTALTAFAQLCALRSGASRALISLFDSHYEHVVAEATSTTPLKPGLRYESATSGSADQDQDHHPGLDASRLLLCGKALPRSSNICEHVLGPENHRAKVSQQGDPLQLPVAIIHDIASQAPDALDCLKENSIFVGVPIRTSKGIDIGVLSILSKHDIPEPDEGLIHFMQDLSRTIMSYLETNASQHAFRRADRMARGIGSFVEQKSTLSGWRHGSNQDSFLDNNSMEGALNSRQQEIPDFDEAGQPEETPGETMPPSNVSQPSPSPGNEQVSQDPTQVSYSSGEAFTIDPGAPWNSPGAPLNSPGTRQPRTLSTLFSEAANIIRESIEVEGVIFVDSSADKPEGETKELKPTNSNSNDPKSGSEDDIEGSHDAIPCHILGHSDSITSSVNGEKGAASYATVPERFLTKLLTRYKKGKIYNLDSDGSLRTSESSSSDDADPQEDNVEDSEDSHNAVDRSDPPGDVSQNAAVPSRRSSKKGDSPDASRRRFSRDTEAKYISQLFPGARSVAFFPIWDATKRRWIAGGFAYTKNPLRIFTVKGELSYLTAFAAITMTEVYRFREDQVTKVTQDLLGSLSHELRSPLHGVILGTELLRDSPLNVSQSDILYCIENCGRTLIDTIDHLLDWSSLSSKKHRSSSSSRGQDSEPLTANTVVEVDELAEQVVESVYAGHSFQRKAFRRPNRAARAASHRQSDKDHLREMDRMRATEEMRMPGASNTPSPSNGNVIISLEINPSSAESWTFDTQAGSIRRIIMNLVGNSLKFTSKGFVKVRLEQMPPTVKRHDNKSRIVRLTITDSGQGISKDYMNSGLFVPFSQENSLSVGTGLGLSLVKKLVQHLGGFLQVRSRVDVGTTFVAEFPMIPKPARTVTNDVDVSNPSETLAAFRTEMKQLAGLRVALKAFPPKGSRINDEVTSGEIDERNIVEGVCRDWLRMCILDDEASGQAADIILYGEGQLNNFSDWEDDATHCPAVIVCRTAVEALQAAGEFTVDSQRGRSVVEFISQPLGPRKLARAVKLAYERWADAQDISDTEPPVVEDLPSRPKDDSQLTRKSGENKSEDSANQADREVGETGSTNERRNESSPIRSVPTLTSSSSRSLASDGGNDGGLILVDDNPINLKILETYMKKLKRSYSVATNGEEAVEAYKASDGSCRVIFMDISMPVMDGLEATRHVRAIERQKNSSPCKVIALTGLTSDESRQEAFDSGVDTFLTKPIKLKQLSDILKEAQT